MRVAAAVLCLWLVGYSAGAVQGQSLYGPGGLFLLPTADVPLKGELTPGVLMLPQTKTPELNEHRVQTWISTSLDYGLTHDLEVGLERLQVTDWPATFGGFAKYRFLRETSCRPAMAVGLVNTGFGENHTPPIGNIHNRSYFVALRKGFLQNSAHPVVGHFGIEYIDVDRGVFHDTLLPYAGAEVGLVPRWTFIAEGRPKGRGDVGTPLALSLSYSYGRGRRVVVTWANEGQSERPLFGFGVGIAIGERR
jgi:hypothetical protein